MEFRTDHNIATFATSSATAPAKKTRVRELDFEGMQFDASEFEEIDSGKYTLFNLTQDAKLDATSIDARLDMMDSWATDLAQNRHYLYRRLMHSGCKPVSQVEDPVTGEVREMINLGSNDYLNLTQHPRVTAAATHAIERYGMGSGSAPMFSGTMNVHRELEMKLAELKGCENAMTFVSGYAANSGAISALLRSNDVAIYDRYCHASLFDGTVNGNRMIFSHNDMRSLEFVLKKTQNRYANKLVIVDGVYSMDGDIAKLNEICDLAHRYGAWVMVDEAHATGVIGKTGKGTLEYFGLEGKVDIVSGTLSKTLGSLGGYIAGSNKLINYLSFTCRPFIFSSSGPVPAAAAALESLHVIQDEPELRDKLWNNILYMIGNLTAMGFSLGNAETAIIPLILGDDYKVKEMSSRLDQAGIFVNSVPYPAVPRRLSRVRISITAGLTRAHLDKALVEIKRIGTELSVF